jgi:transcriptional regulator with XRE-family HTH domain
VDKVGGPLGPRRRVAAALRQLREESGRNLADVAAELMISSSKLSRLENAQGKPRPRDVRDLVRLYGQEGTKVAAQLQRWATAAQVPGWWTDFDDEVLTGGIDRHLAYEADAAIERVYTLPFVPVLLQTDEYGEAVYRDLEQRPEEQIPDLMAIRRERRSALASRAGLDPLELVAVTHESTLRQVVGSPAILCAQLDELICRSADANVTLRVLPFTAAPVRTMTCMYAYFEYHDADDLEQDVVHIETHAGFWSIEDADRVAEYRQWHDSLVQAALSEDDSRVLMAQIRDSMRLGP